MYINKLALALWKDPERRLAEVAKLRAVVDLLLAEREALHKGLKQMREEEIQRD
jgi:hypothetical protein